MALPKNIPIEVARDIARRYGYTQVVITAFSAEVNGFHVTTYGSDAEQCRQAALGGDFVKAAIGNKWKDSN